MATNFLRNLPKIDTLRLSLFCSKIWSWMANSNLNILTPKYNASKKTRTLSSYQKSDRDNSYLLFYDVFYVLSIFCKFESSTTQTTFLRCKWHENSTFQEVAAQLVAPLVHSATFSLVPRRAMFLHYKSLDNWIFQKLPCTAEVAGFMRISISAVHSARFTPSTTQDEFF